MNFEWDEAKREKNLAKLRIDFEDAIAMWEGPMIVREDRRREYGEPRWVGFGRVRGVVVTVAFTVRQGTVRMISARRASEKERNAFGAKIASQ